MATEKFPDGPDNIKASLIICGIIVAVSACLIAFFCASCSDTAIKFFEKEVEQVNREVNEELNELSKEDLPLL